MTARNGNRLHDVVDAAGDHDADRHLAIIGRVGGIHRAGTRIKAHFAFYSRSEITLERRRINGSASM